MNEDNILCVSCIFIFSVYWCFMLKCLGLWKGFVFYDLGIFMEVWVISRFDVVCCYGYWKVGDCFFFVLFCIL